MLRSNGNMNFGEVTEVIPWDVVALGKIFADSMAR
jgi:hypothetical protein